MKAILFALLVTTGFMANAELPINDTTTRCYWIGNVRYCDTY